MSARTKTKVMKLFLALKEAVDKQKASQPSPDASLVPAKGAK